MNKKIDEVATKIEHRGCCGWLRVFQTYTFRVVLNVVARAICFAHIICLTAYCYYYMYDTYYLFLPLSACIGIFIEGFIVLYLHDGKQSKWFSFCMFFYLMSVIPYFWVLETKSVKLERANPGSAVVNDFPKFLQQSFYIIIILLRLLLPTYNASREQTSNVVKFLLNVVSDAQEFQSNVAELRTKENHKKLFYEFSSVELYLITWTWSLPLFCVNIDETLEDTDENNVNMDNSKPKSKEEAISEQRLIKMESMFIFKLFKNFYWKFFFVLLLIDLPYLTVRLVSKFYFKVSPTDIYFFIGKNAVQVLLGIHRVICRVWFPDDDDSNDGETDNKTQRNLIEINDGNAEKESKQKSIKV